MLHTIPRYQGNHMITSLGYEESITNFARKILDDIPECNEQECEMKVRFIEKIPILILAFNLPETIHQPALAIRLETISKTKPLDRGNILEGERLYRHIRQSTEHYLTKNGVKLLLMEES